MQLYHRLGVLCGVLLFVSGLSAQVDQNRVAEFARSYTDRHNGMSLAQLTVILNNAQFQQSIVDKMDKPAEGSLTWERYRSIFLTDERISAGVEFWKQNAAVLAKVSADSGVPEEIILSVIGVETFYGQRMGSYRVLDALYTLAFAYPKRASFFTAELEKFLELIQQQGLDIYAIKGSYAGAIGYCQFMPSSYQAYARSFEEGSTDLMKPDDAIASVANYLKVNHWVQGGIITIPVNAMVSPQTAEETQSVKPSHTLRYYSDLGYMPSGNLSPSLMAALIDLDHEDGSKEYWFGFDDFYVITRYNHSRLYAMAVYQLSEAIKASKAGM